MGELYGMVYELFLQKVVQKTTKIKDLKNCASLYITNIVSVIVPGSVQAKGKAGNSQEHSDE